MAQIVLENNYFVFHDKIFHQKLGAAGTKFAPSFANNFMADLERLYLQSVPYKPWLWWRFLDDRHHDFGHMVRPSSVNSLPL